MPPRSVSNTRSTAKPAAGTGGTANGRGAVAAKGKGKEKLQQPRDKRTGTTGGTLHDSVPSADGKGSQEVNSEQHIVVGVRLRPFVSYERDGAQAGCMEMDENHVRIAPKNLGVHGREAGFGEKVFAFDHAMDSSNPKQPGYISQQKCYSLMCGRMVEHMFEGYATCLFAYGQTGSGKTTTIMGNIHDEEEQGILVRLLRDTFEQVDALKDSDTVVQCKVQMVEVYNERIQDLLAPSKEAADISVHMHPQLGVYVKNALEDSVDDLATCIKILEYGNSMKSVAATAVNAKSSRGHTLFKLTVERQEGHTITSSQSFFVDLAGRENEKTTLVTGARLIELSFINKSLSFLAQCIDALGKPAKEKGNDHRYLFRNSKLTMLLSDALSRNSKTAMIGTLSPALQNFEESLTTLNFCSTIKKIKVNAKARIGLDKDGLLQSLQNEIACLRKEEQVSANVQQQLIQMQATVDEYRQKLEEEQLKVEKAQDAHKEAVAKLGLGKWKHVLDKGKRAPDNSSRFPYLANYSDEPTASGTLVLHPEEDGIQYLAGWDDRLCDMVLPKDVGIPRMACYFWKERGRLFINGYVDPNESRNDDATPSSLVEVNGVQVGLETREIFHRDAVVIGTSLLMYAFTDESDVGRIRQHPAINSQMSRLLEAALSEERKLDPLQQQIAEVNLQHLQRQCRDSVGTAQLADFLCRTALGEEKVQEANSLNAELYERGMEFQLFAAAPVLGQGFAQSRLPELCVRLVQMGDADGNQWSGTQFLYSWSLPEFVSLVGLMHSMEEQGLLEPGRLEINPSDPWRERAENPHGKAAVVHEKPAATAMLERPAQRWAWGTQLSQEERAWNEAERLEKLKKENRRLKETVQRLQLQAAEPRSQNPLSHFSDRDATLSDSARTNRSTDSSSQRRSSSCPGKERRAVPPFTAFNQASNFRRYEESANPGLIRGLFGGGHPSTYRR
eukprot:TRINITY_DN23159_c0_g1_i1.p1 TRINITY_DN23159_c0_g1~~TRINITY_DN23159_c0_g1_i1.p1  ORF type:complete len:957 (-),score=188.99 TRINITY_DN23159_c0_g1_i1:107-2977(-)